MNTKNLNFLHEKITELCDQNYVLKSRVHKLLHLENNLYIKRDDELSYAVSGSKFRKYASLLPHLKKIPNKKFIIIGGARSNNVIGLSLMMLENNLDFELVLLGSEDLKVNGNSYLLKFTVPAKKIHWIQTANWQNINEIVRNELFPNCKNCVIIPEGADMEESLWGGMTLALDILRNEREHSLKFEHIFLDSGTGNTAIAFILANSFVESSAKIYVTLIAGAFEEFEVKLKQYSAFFTKKMAILGFLPKNFQLFYPSTARSFGNVNSSVKQFCINATRKSGVLFGPIYSGKHLMRTLEVITENQILGNKLFIHSGGGNALFAYEDVFKKFL